MAPSATATRGAGFTLVELIVAVFVFSLMALFAYAGVDQVITARVQSKATLDQLGDLQFAIRQMGLDLGQLHPRPVREVLGDTVQPAVLADLRRYHQLELTRAGWRNPLGLPRPSLQRVAYRLEDGSLIRAHWNVLDRLQANQPVETTLLEGIEEFELRFLKGDGDWTDSWPDPDAAPEFAVDARPRAVEIRLRFEDEERGDIRRVFEVLR